VHGAAESIFLWAPPTLWGTATETLVCTHESTHPKVPYKNKIGGGGVPYIPPRYPVHFPGGQADAPWQASPPGIELLMGT